MGRAPLGGVPLPGGVRDLAQVHEGLGDLVAAERMRVEALTVFHLYGSREYAEMME
ncbi:hypothetical protein GCM10022226_60720 [Sphaerisporangium flaviroseum]|uniref:Uncharacterized protein n=1 Tax=Sphaerisporangium flaviroseum TaxID=509199 RepID=A0ABP7J1A8_9ACTN